MRTGIQQSYIQGNQTTPVSPIHSDAVQTPLNVYQVAVFHMVTTAGTADVPKTVTITTQDMEEMCQRADDLLAHSSALGV